MKEHEKKAGTKKGEALEEKALAGKVSEGKTSNAKALEGKTSKAKQGRALALQQNAEQIDKANWHHEDLAMKTAAQYFGEELLPLLGIRGEVEYIAPTETVKLETRQFYQDFNYAMKEGSWVHLEFESDEITREDLKRFREYEAATSRAYKVDIVTYVICSADVKKLRSELKSGINTYCVEVIRLKGKDADRLFKAIEEKKAKGGALLKSDLVPLLLTPLMSGSLEIGERIIKSLKILRTAEAPITPLELEKMQAVLYTFADKFLDKSKLAKVKEVMSMTLLGEMLINDGIEQGIERGREQALQVVIEICEELGLTFDQTVEKMETRFDKDPQSAREIVERYWK